MLGQHASEDSVRPCESACAGRVNLLCLRAKPWHAACPERVPPSPMVSVCCLSCFQCHPYATCVSADTRAGRQMCGAW